MILLPFGFTITIGRSPKTWCKRNHTLDGKTICSNCRTSYTKDSYLRG